MYYQKLLVYFFGNRSLSINRIEGQWLNVVKHGLLVGVDNRSCDMSAGNDKYHTVLFPNGSGTWDRKCCQGQLRAPTGRQGVCFAGKLANELKQLFFKICHYYLSVAIEGKDMGLPLYGNHLLNTFFVNNLMEVVKCHVT